MRTSYFSDIALCSRLTRIVVYIGVWDRVPVHMVLPAVVDVVVIVNSGRELRSVKYFIQSPELRTLAIQGREKFIYAHAKHAARFARVALRRQLNRRLRLLLQDAVLEGQCSEFDPHFYEMEYVGPRFPL